VNTPFRKRIKRFWCKLAQVVMGDASRPYSDQRLGSGGQRSNGQGHAKPWWDSSVSIREILTKPRKHIILQ